MWDAQIKMLDFMDKAKQECPIAPTTPSVDVKALRLDLIGEEFLELARAFGFELEIVDGELKSFYESHSLAIKEDVVEVADGLGDLLYVVLGTAVACGIDIEPIFNEIHRSNMTKFIDGTFREDGKYVKGPSYSKPNLLPLLISQGYCEKPTEPKL